MKNYRAGLIPCLVVCILFCASLPLSLSAQKLGAKGRLILVVRNENNEKLSSATVALNVVGINPKSTDVNGEAEFDLEPGIYSVTVSYASYETKNDTGIVVVKGEVLRHPVSLAFKTGEAVVITSQRRPTRESVGAVLAIQKNNSAVSDVMSIEQIRRTPDVTVGDAIKRMNGVTVVDNKFVVVRGMGERYNTTLLNGSQLPSTEANKKNFSFDLIPSSVIDNIIVTKTATPDLPADFSGGIVQVTTKEIPDKNSYSITIGTGYNSISTGRAFISTPIDRKEFFSVVPSDRKWFLGNWNPNIYLKLVSTDQQALRAMNAQIPNNWSFQQYIATPSQNYQFSAGLRKRFKNRSSLGFLLAGSYRNTQSIEQEIRQLNGNNDSTSGRNFSFNTDISGLASLGYSIGTNKLTLRSVYTRKLTHENNLFSGTNTNGEFLDAYSSYLTTVDLIQNRLEGEHILTGKKLRLKWYGDLAKVNRNLEDGRTAPRFSVGTSTPNYDYIDKFPSRGGVSASDYEETRYNLGLDLSVPFQLFKQKQTIKLGYLYSKREVDYYYSFLRYLIPFGPNVVDIRDNKFFGKPLGQVMTPQNILDGFVTYAPISSTIQTSGGQSVAADFYSAAQVNKSYFFMGDLNLSEKFRLIAGARYEDNLIKIEQVTERDSLTNDPKAIKVTSLPQGRLFPSANLVYKLSKASNIRLAYSQTTARPDFRDVVNIGYFDFTTFNDVVGNDSLRNSLISNYDLRYELFPSPGEVFSITLFYKKFEDPIESNLRDLGSDNFQVSPVNLLSSTNLGVELDFRKSLAFISKSSKWWKRFYVSGNFSYMKSEVALDPKLSGSTVAEVRERPLQGLSPYSINGGLLYDGEKMGANITYNRFGRRLLYQGDRAYQDIYEFSRNVIDLQFFVRMLKKKLELKLNLNDILNDPYILYSNIADVGSNRISGTPDPNNKLDFNAAEDYLRRRTNRGTGISFSLNYKF